MLWKWYLPRLWSCKLQTDGPSRSGSSSFSSAPRLRVEGLREAPGIQRARREERSEKSERRKSIKHVDPERRESPSLKGQSDASLTQSQTALFREGSRRAGAKRRRAILVLAEGRPLLLGDRWRTRPIALILLHSCLITESLEEGTGGGCSVMNGPRLWFNAVTQSSHLICQTLVSVGSSTVKRSNAKQCVSSWWRVDPVYLWLCVGSLETEASNEAVNDSAGLVCDQQGAQWSLFQKHTDGGN